MRLVFRASFSVHPPLLSLHPPLAHRQLCYVVIWIWHFHPVFPVSGLALPWPVIRWLITMYLKDKYWCIIISVKLLGSSRKWNFTYWSAITFLKTMLKLLSFHQVLNLCMFPDDWELSLKYDLFYCAMQYITEVIEADNFLLHFCLMLLLVLVCLCAAVSSAFSLKASCLCTTVRTFAWAVHMLSFLCFWSLWAVVPHSQGAEN